MSMENQTLLEIVSTAIAGTLGWAFRLERRAQATAARQKDHEELCTERQATIRRDLSEIKEMLAKQDERSGTHREAVAKSLGEIHSDIAVLQAIQEQQEKRA